MSGVGKDPRGFTRMDPRTEKKVVKECVLKEWLRGITCSLSVGTGLWRSGLSTQKKGAGDRRERRGGGRRKGGGRRIHMQIACIVTQNPRKIPELP